MNDRASIVYYVSGHGLGHARRSSRGIRELLSLRPGLGVHVRTSAAARIFPPQALIHDVCIDPRIAEAGPLHIDWDQSVRNLEGVLARKNAIVADEVRFIRQIQPALILADASFLAGDIAHACGVPCFAVTNFTWDWIFEPYLIGPRRELYESVRRSYSKMTGILRLPFASPPGVFAREIPMPHIATQSQRSREQIDRILGLDPADRRPRCLIGIRGGVPPEALARAAGEADDLLFLSPDHLPSPLPVDFSDLIAACDVVLSKLGYSIIADCLAARVPLLWPARNGFREDPISSRQASDFIPMLEISHDDFHAGRWANPLRALLRMPRPTQIPRTDGAAKCAEFIDSFLGG